MAKSGKKKIAILGGGVGSLVTAWELTNRAEDRSRYEITVYQVGYRLGGKAASGRNREVRDRIEEHGLHVFIGFYENAFRVMRRCYQELDRPENSLLSRCVGGSSPAFKPFDQVTLMKFFQEQWRHWDLPFPKKNGLPGDIAMSQNGELSGHFEDDRGPWALFLDLIEWLRNYYDASVDKGSNLQAAHLTDPGDAPPNPVPSSGALSGQGALTQLHVAERLAKQAHTEGKGKPTPNRMKDVTAALDQFVQELPSGLVGDFDDYKNDVILRLGAAILRGMIEDNVIVSGFDAINDLDLLEWLQRHGVVDEEIWWSPVMQMIYDLALAYEPKNLERNLAAGTGLRGMLNTLFRYRGHVAWKMQAGMGDVVIMPLYQVLKKRGVKFKFFHRVEGLKLSKDKTRIGSIKVGIQAKIKKDQNGKEGDYDPICPVKETSTGLTLDCWPSAPNYSQLDLDGKLIKELQELHEQGIDPFESAWSPWENRETTTLRRGKDFDLVVLGISIGALRHLCGPLVKEDPRWAQMVREVKTVQSQALQLWLSESWGELGWPPDGEEGEGIVGLGPEPFVGTFRFPYSTWASMCHLIDRENFPKAKPGIAGIETITPEVVKKVKEVLDKRYRKMLTDGLVNQIQISDPDGAAFLQANMPNLMDQAFGAVKVERVVDPRRSRDGIEKPVRSIAYFCGVLQDADKIPKPSPNREFALGQHLRVRDLAERFIEEEISGLWPNSGTGTSGRGAGFNWDLVVGVPPDSVRKPDAEPIDSQFWKANVNPSDRYVLSVKGSTECRLRAHESGFENLFLAGDWVRTGLDAGCAEAATMSGIQAARAITGRAIAVPGEEEFITDEIISTLIGIFQLGLDANIGLLSATGAALEGLKRELQAGKLICLSPDNAVLRGLVEGATCFFEDLQETARNLHGDLPTVRSSSPSEADLKGGAKADEKTNRRLLQLFQRFLWEEVQRLRGG